MLLNSYFSNLFSFFMLLCAGLMSSFAGLSYAASDNSTATSSDERLEPSVRSVKSALDIGYINISLGGLVCYQKPEHITLWRENSQRAEYLRLKNITTEQQVNLRWLAGQEHLAWPVDKLSVHDGTTYLLKMGNLAEIVVFYQMPADLQTITEQNQWLQEQRCRVQIAESNAAETPPESAPEPPNPPPEKAS